MPHAQSIRRIALLALTTGLVLCTAGPPVATAAPTLAMEEAQGESIAASVRAGEQQCSDLSADDLELIGEYAMGRYLGGDATHSAMNRRMTRMMGEAGERRMHVALGHRFSGCSGGPASGWVGPMAGMMAGRGTGGDGQGMMGGGESGEHRDYLAAMMGSRGRGGGELSALGVVLIALAAAAVGAAAATLFHRRREPPDEAAR